MITSSLRIPLVATTVTVALLAAACGGSGDEASTTTTLTSTSTTLADSPAPTTTQIAEPAGSDSATDDGGYLAAADVAAYITAFEAGAAASFVDFGGEQFPVDRVAFIEGLDVQAGQVSVQLAIGDDGLDDVAVVRGDDVWTLDGGAAAVDYLRVPSEFDAESDDTVLHVVAPLVSLTGGDAETIELAFDVALIGAGDSTVDLVGSYAVINGTLGTETYIQLRDVIEQHPEVDTLVMQSVEGSENDEINVHSARLIREAGWTTWLPANGDIASGGVDMFLAGVDRIVEPGGFVGVHSWGTPDSDVAAIDLPADHPAHRSQLEYVDEMLGADAGPAFYWFTLVAAPFEGIHRMTDTELAQFGITTAEPTSSLPAELIGQPAAYLALPGSFFLKASVDTCAIDGTTVTAELTSPELGAALVTLVDGAGTLAFTDLPVGLAPDQPVGGGAVTDGFVDAIVDLDLADLFGVNAPGTTLTIDCR